jgi:hypothetical protein
MLPDDGGTGSSRSTSRSFAAQGMASVSWHGNVARNGTTEPSLPAPLPGGEGSKQHRVAIDRTRSTDSNDMTQAGSTFLLLGAGCSALAALAHVGIVLGGPAWYRFFGAGEGMSRLAASGSWYPALVTLAIAAVLAAWAAYALSAAGVLPRLPLLRWVLVAITGIYLLRGGAGFVLAAAAPGGNSPTFWVWSSMICLLIGALHAAGLARAWPALTVGHA